MLKIHFQFEHPLIGEIDGPLDVDLTRDEIREYLPQAMSLPEGYQCFEQDDVIYCCAPNDTSVEVGRIIEEE